MFVFGMDIPLVETLLVIVGLMVSLFVMLTFLVYQILTLKEKLSSLFEENKKNAELLKGLSKGVDIGEKEGKTKPDIPAEPGKKLDSIARDVSNIVEVKEKGGIFGIAKKPAKEKEVRRETEAEKTVIKQVIDTDMIVKLTKEFAKELAKKEVAERIRKRDAILAKTEKKRSSNRKKRKKSRKSAKIKNIAVKASSSRIHGKRNPNKTKKGKITRRKNARAKIGKRTANKRKSTGGKGKHKKKGFGLFFGR